MTDIYYGLSKFGTGDHLDDGGVTKATISIDGSGNATVVLNDEAYIHDTNIGIGVAVDYNGVTSYIDSYTSSTSFHLITGVGATASSQTSTNLTKVYYPFSGLADAEANYSTPLGTNDLVTNTYLLKLCAYYDPHDQTLDTTATFNATTTNTTYYIDIIAPTDSDAENNQRSETGVLNTSKYYLKHTTTGNYQSGIRQQDDNIKMTGLQVEVIHGANTQSACVQSFGGDIGTGGTLDVEKCIFKGGHFGHRNTDADLTTTIANSLLYDATTDNVSLANGTTTLHNCTVMGSVDGVQRSSGTMVVRNSIVGDNSGSDFNGTITVTYCASDDGTGSNPQTLSGTRADDFVDFGGSPQDFRIVADSVCEEGGDDLSGGTPAITDDIIGTARPKGTLYDCGYHELIPVVGGATPSNLLLLGVG